MQNKWYNRESDFVRRNDYDDDDEIHKYMGGGTPGSSVILGHSSTRPTSQFSLLATQSEYRNEINRNDVKHDRWS